MIKEYLNLILTIVLIVQVVYLFTCGQAYLKKSYKRSGVDFVVPQCLYLVGIVIILIHSVYEEISWYSVFTNVLFNVLVFQKILPIYQIIKRI